MVLFSKKKNTDRLINCIVFFNIKKMVKKYKDDKPAKIIYGEEYQKILLRRFKNHILQKMPAWPQKRMM